MTKKIFFLILIFTSFSDFMVANDSRIDSLLKVLDKTIKERPIFHKQKEQKIDSLEQLLLKEPEKEGRYNIYSKIFDEYSRYNLDSALQVAYKIRELANSFVDERYMYTANMNISEILGRMGMYKESLDILNAVQFSALDQEGKVYYYHLYHSLYALLEENSISQNEKNYYKNIVLHYKDSLILVLPPNNITHATMRKGIFLSEGRYTDAQQVLDSCLVSYRQDKSMEGILNYELSDVYEKKGEITQQKKFLIRASIYDLKRAVRSYIALRKLAILLYKEGDIDRANTYMRCAMEDAIACRARFRTLEISETLPIIAAAYDKQEELDKDKLLLFLALISILTVILGISILYIWKQLKKLSVARTKLDDMYNELKKMNSELNNFNIQLTESNLVKEEYIGTVFNMCSTYIDKMESYRININRKLKAGQAEDALKLTGSNNLVANELKDFFQLFDAVFMNIYPNFIEDFNVLLLENEKIYPKGEDILSPELRVFALMRLGITDSSKIANFLHYSPQTIYNYKLRIKNKLAVSKEEFSEKIHIKW